MYTLRDRPVLALVSEGAHREAVVWCAWVIAASGHARLQVAEGDLRSSRAADSRLASTHVGSVCRGHSSMDIARRLVAVERPAMLVADWEAGSSPQGVLRLAASSDAAAVLVRWPQGRTISRVLVPSGGGLNSLGQLWIAREIASRRGCSAKVLHVVCEDSCVPGVGAGTMWAPAVTDIQARTIGMPGPVEVTVASDVVSGVAAETLPDDLVAIGAPNHYRMPEYFEGSIPDLIARRLPNPLMMFLGRKTTHARLRDVFWPEMIRLGLDATSKEEAIAVLVNTLIRHYQVPDAWRDRLLELALARERAMSTAVGCETAFPHITVPDCAGVAGCLGIFPSGLDFGNGNGRDTRFVFLLVTPEDYYDEYLGVLARIAELMARPAVRRELLDCTTPAAVLEVLDPEGV